MRNGLIGRFSSTAVSIFGKATARWSAVASRGILHGFALCLVLAPIDGRADTPPAMSVPGQFNVNQLGGATYSIPISVPPGTGGMTPSLSLEYSSMGTDGILGLGWSLSGLPAITRCPRTLAQDKDSSGNPVHGSVNYDNNDRFCLDGQRLVSINGAYGANNTEYRTEVEGFARIVSYGTAGNGPSSFKLWTKSGQIMEFGNTEDSRIQINKSTDTSTVRVWAVNKVSDTVGNYLTVAYTEDQTNGQFYPAEIDYAGNSNTSQAPYNAIVFVYNTSRPDVTPFYQAGAVQKTTVLLTDIKTYLGTTATGLTTLVYDYKLGYTLGTTSRISELTSVTLCGGTDTCSIPCNGSSSCLATTTFTWQGTRDVITIGTPWTTTAFTSDYNLGALVQPGDFNGDGLTDILPYQFDTQACDIYNGNTSGGFTAGGYSATYSYIYKDPETGQTIPMNGDLCFADAESSQGPAGAVVPIDPDGDGFADLSFTMFDVVSPGRYFLTNNKAGNLAGGLVTGMGYGGQFQFGDYNGDGRTDIYDPSGSYFFSNGDGTYQQLTGPVTNGMYETRIPSDFDGDGCTDLLTQGHNVTAKIYFSCNPPAANVGVPNWTDNQYTIVMGDFNGDGKTDVFRQYGPNNDPAALFLSYGTSIASTATWVHNGPDINGHDTDFTMYTIYTGDFNGDGKTDLLLVADGITVGSKTHYGYGHASEIWLATGKTGSYDVAFVYAGSIPASNDSRDKPINNAPAIRAVVGDFNSDGADDIWILKPSGDQLYEMTYSPEKITTFSNGLGAATTVTYDRINKNAPLYQKCATAGTYVCGDAWPLIDDDGPIYVVKQVDATNGIGGTYTSTYSYGQARSDAKGRGLLGFAQMTVTDVQTHIVQTKNYSTTFPYLGLVTSSTKVCPAGVCGAAAVTLSSTVNTYETVSLGNGTDGVARYYAALHQSVVSATDADGSPLPTVTTTYTYDCDTGTTSICAGATPTGFGNTTQVAQTTAMPDGSDSSTKTTTSTFDNDTSNGHWYLGRVRTSNVESVAGSSDITRQTAYTYDTGNANSTGLLTSEVIEPSATSCNTGGGTGGIACKLETDYTYDAYGNKTSVATTGLGAIIVGGAQTLASTTRTNSTIYVDAATDPNSQFPFQVTNALSQSETWQYSFLFGKGIKHTGPNGQIATWIYDAFGRQTREHRPDGTETQMAYFFCSGVNGGTFACPTNASVAVRTTPTKSDHTTQIGAQKIVYYDSLYRPVAADAQGFGGAWVRQATCYDSFGRTKKTSRPYFRDQQGVTIYWTINAAFDPLGRVTALTHPDSSFDTFAFDGLTTSVTKHILGGSTSTETTTTLKNARGLTVSVTNAMSKSATYAYDATGNLTTVTDSAGNVSSYKYDLRGAKYDAVDPDMGHWTYQFDAFGSLYEQTDAKGQTATVSYDALARAVKRTDADLVSQWIYGNDPGLDNVGKLIEACTGSCSGNDYQRILSYDDTGRPKTVTLSINGVQGVYTVAYDASTGRVASLKYPSNLKVLYNYDATLGYLTSVTDNATGTVLWTANARDAEMHLTQQTAGDNVVTIQYFNPATGRISQIRASSDGMDDGSLANFTYTFDSNGTLMQRVDPIADGANPYAENFCYDALNRLTNSAVGATTSTSCTAGRVTKAQTYDDLGDILTKDGNSYKYANAGQAQPHAIKRIVGTVNGIVNPRYDYDADGNLACSHTGTDCTGSAIVSQTSWTSYNMVSSLVQGAVNMSLFYDAERTRIRQHEVNGATTTDTTYYNDPMSGALAESVTVGTTTVWHDYVIVEGHIAAERFKNGSSTSWNYFLLDHLGSTSAITTSDGSGHAIVVTNGRLSFDAWGRQRNLDGTDDTTCSKPAGVSTTRGFTGQEAMPDVCLINFNARIYDPTVGRFLSPDPVTQNQFDMQVLNRFTYVGNNPLSFTDPSGNFFAFLFFFAFVAVAVLGPEIQKVPILGDLATILASFGCGPAAAVCSAIISAEVTGVSGGTPAQAFKAAVLSFAEAKGFEYANSIVGVGNDVEHVAERFLARGLVGGIASAAGGHSFASGFLAAGVSSLADAAQVDLGSRAANILVNTMEHAVLGGFGSVLGGGKFANGAATAAFAYAASASFRDEDPISAGSAHSMSPSGYETGQVGPFSYQMAPGCNTAEWCGVDLKLHYTGDAKNLDWLQTVSAVSSREFGDWVIDDSSSSNRPFYTKAWSGGPDFEDWPAWPGDRGFLAETTLLSRNADGSYTAIGTVKWGYSYTTSYGEGADHVTMFTPTLTAPSSVQQHWIDSVNGH
jgi:RHS repeat-associated protein